MATPVTNFRLTPEDKRRIQLIKHLSGYLTDARAIRAALKDHLERLESDKKGGD